MTKIACAKYKSFALGGRGLKSEVATDCVARNWKGHQTRFKEDKERRV